jgi:chromosome segregation ATPase
MSEQEWTPEWLRNHIGHFSIHEQQLAEACRLHKAALAAERERILAYQAQIRETNGKLMETRTALAAEHEKNEGAFHHVEACRSIIHRLEQQLAAVTKQRDDFRRALEQRIREVDELREKLKCV